MEQAKQNTQRSSPADFLRLILGKSVRVKLTNNTEYTGLLVSLDETMNVVLEKADEFEIGKLKRKYEEVFLRGNNGRSLVTQFSTSILKQERSRDIPC